jgi:hypothetical protein
MELKPITGNQTKARVSLQGVAGSGKTYSALLLAYALAGDYSKIAIIETAYASAHHYSYLGTFQTLTLASPFSTEKFLDAIALCERSDIEVIIIDSLSAQWTGSGGMLDRLKEEGEEAMHWHESVMAALQQSPCHLLCTLQTEESYHLAIYAGERKVEKHGLRPLQREDIHQHFHTCLYLDREHKAHSLKDRSSFFEEHKETIITEELANLFALRYLETNIYSLQNQHHESIKNSA